MEGRIAGPVPVLTVLVVGALGVGLEQGIVAPALPAIERHYGALPAAGTWLLSGFLLASAIVVPLAGRIGDQLGRRRVLVWSLLLGALGSAVCAVSPSMGLLIAGRVVQGFGAGLAPLAFALARDNVAPARVPMAIGLLVAATAAGAAIAFVLAGLLVDNVSVSSIFWLLFAVDVSIAALARLAIPESPTRVTAPVDRLGALLLTGGLGSLALAVSEGSHWGWGSTRTVLCYCLAAAFMAAFATRERTAATPLIDPKVLALRSIWSANIAMCGLGFSLIVALALVPLSAAYPKATGYGLGLSTTDIGLMIVPNAIGVLVGALLGGRLILRTGARVIALAGVALATLSYALLALSTPTVAALTLEPIPLGIGSGLAVGAIFNLAVLASPVALTASTVSLSTTIRLVSAALGAQVAVAVVTAAPAAFPGLKRLAAHLLHAGITGPHVRLVFAEARIPARSGFTSAFWMAAAATVVALLMIALTPSRRTDPTLERGI